MRLYLAGSLLLAVFIALSGALPLTGREDWLPYEDDYAVVVMDLFHNDGVAASTSVSEELMEEREKRLAQVREHKHEDDDSSVAEDQDDKTLVKRTIPDIDAQGCGQGHSSDEHGSHETHDEYLKHEAEKAKLSRYRRDADESGASNSSESDEKKEQKKQDAAAAVVAASKDEQVPNEAAKKDEVTRRKRDVHDDHMHKSGEDCSHEHGEKNADAAEDAHSHCSGDSCTLVHTSKTEEEKKDDDNTVKSEKTESRRKRSISDEEDDDDDDDFRSNEERLSNLKYKRDADSDSDSDDSASMERQREQLEDFKPIAHVVDSSVQDYAQGCEVMEVNSYEANETTYNEDRRRRSAEDNEEVVESTAVEEIPAKNKDDEDEDK